MSLTDGLKIELTTKSTLTYDELVRSITDSFSRSVGSRWGITASGSVRINPWLFGTVIRPTFSNASFPRTSRHMVIGMTSDMEAIMTLDLRATEPSYMPYRHLAAGLFDRWEPVPETDD